MYRWSQYCERGAGGSDRKKRRERAILAFRTVTWRKLLASPVCHGLGERAATSLTDKVQGCKNEIWLYKVETKQS